MADANSLRNHFLIALPALKDPDFSHSVTLICQHDTDGAMGITINRPSDYRLGELFEQMELDPAQVTGHGDDRVLTGGPVRPERGFVLHDGEPDDFESSLAIAPGICLTSSRAIIEAIAAGNGPRHTLVTLGFAGWQAGQLEAELQQDAWLTVAADPAIIFELPIEVRWQAAANLMGVDLDRLTGYSGHA